MNMNEFYYCAGVEHLERDVDTFHAILVQAYGSDVSHDEDRVLWVDSVYRACNDTLDRDFSYYYSKLQADVSEKSALLDAYNVYKERMHNDKDYWGNHIDNALLAELQDENHNVVVAATQNMDDSLRFFLYHIKAAFSADVSREESNKVVEDAYWNCLEELGNDFARFGKAYKYSDSGFGVNDLLNTYNAHREMAKSYMDYWNMHTAEEYAMDVERLLAEVL